MTRQNDLIVAPSILSADFSNLQKEQETIASAHADWIHLDVMDGQFVPNLTFGPKLVADLRQHSRLFFDVHLMVKNPDSLLIEYHKAGADAITFHWEAEVHHHRLLMRIRELGLKSGICVVPSTPIEFLEDILPFVDLVLVMSVNPGFGGQQYLSFCTKKIRWLYEKRSQGAGNYLISVDGGINRSTFLEPTGAGADILVTGSAFFQAPDKIDFVRLLKSSRRVLK